MAALRPVVQEAARKALQDMFKGQKDVLAAYDPGEAVSVGDGSGGKGGGSGIDWRLRWREWGDGFSRGARVRLAAAGPHVEHHAPGISSSMFESAPLGPEYCWVWQGPQNTIQQQCLLFPGCIGASKCPYAPA